MSFLDIIIPQYNESEEIVERLLHSIDKQKNIDFSNLGIIIVNDCSTMYISNKITAKFPNLNIRLLRTPKNVGPGLSRQYGIDNSTANYLTFIDADDVYYSDSCLSEVFKVLNEKSYDVLLTNWMEETFINNKYTNILHKSDIIYLHGKFINREFLNQNNFRFSEKLRLHEDTFFCSNILFNSKNIHHIDVITNHWKFNKNSLVRKNYKYHYLISSYKDLITSNKELINELEKRNNPIKNEYAVKSIVYNYCILASKLFENKKDYSLQKLKKEYESIFYAFLQDNLESFDRVGQEKAALYMNEQINIFKKTIINAPLIENWQEFITRLFKENE